MRNPGGGNVQTTLFRQKLRSHFCYDHITGKKCKHMLLEKIWLNKLIKYRFDIHSKKRTTCSGLMKTGLNNVLLPTLFKVVNNIEQVDEP